MFDIEFLKKKCDGLRFGLRCMAALGGYKYAPEGMTHDQIFARSEETMKFLTEEQIKMAAAEQVILDWGKVGEYQLRVDEISKAWNHYHETHPEKVDQAALQAALKAIMNMGRNRKNGKKTKSTGTGGITLGDALGPDTEGTGLAEAQEESHEGSIS